MKLLNADLLKCDWFLSYNALRLLDCIEMLVENKMRNYEYLHKDTYIIFGRRKIRYGVGIQRPYFKLHHSTFNKSFSVKIHVKVEKFNFEYIDHDIHHYWWHKLEVQDYRIKYEIKDGIKKEYKPSRMFKFLDEFLSHNNLYENLTFEIEKEVIEWQKY